MRRNPGSMLAGLLTTREIGQVPSEHQLYSNAAPSSSVGHNDCTRARHDWLAGLAHMDTCARLHACAMLPCSLSACARTHCTQTIVSLGAGQSTTIIAVALCTPNSTWTDSRQALARRLWTHGRPGGHACSSRTTCGRSSDDRISEPVGRQPCYIGLGGDGAWWPTSSCLSLFAPLRTQTAYRRRACLTRSAAAVARRATHARVACFLRLCRPRWPWRPW